MRNLVLGLSITVALLAGCIIGATASRVIVPPVRAGTNLTKWEYYCFEENSKLPLIQKNANKLGALGFELAGVGTDRSDMYWCFKRRRP